MSNTVIVQISERQHSRTERLEVGADGLTIGRAWSSDIIVQDKYVDQQQLRLSMDEQGVARVHELANTNPSTLAGAAIDADGSPYQWGEQLQIGDTRIRFFTAEQAVSATVARSSWHVFHTRMHSKPALIGIGLLVALLSTWLNWVFNVEPLGLKDNAAHFATALAGLFVWVLIFGSITKLITGQSRLKSHWTLICCLLIISISLGLLVMLVRFNSQSLEFGKVFSQIVYGGFSLLLFYSLFNLMSSLSKQMKWAISLLLVGIGFAALHSQEFLKEDHEAWTHSAKYEQTSLPPAFLLRQPNTVEQHFSAVDKLFAQVQQKALESQHSE